MTNQLKDLMTEAVDTQPPYVPDLDALVRTGRRQVRRRRAAGVVATVAAASIVIGATTVAFDTINRSSEPPIATRTSPPDAWSLPSMGPNGSTGVCTTADGKRVPATTWPAVLLIQDRFGTAAVRNASGNPAEIAFCTTEWGDGAKLSVVPGTATDRIVLRKNAANGRGAAAGSSVTVVFGAVPRGTPPRVTVQTADGHVGVATVKNGYFAYRRVEHSAWPGPEPHAIVRFKYPGKPEYVAASR